MARENLNDLAAFLAVAREGSFTRAAAKLGVSQSALSQTVRAVEARLGLRLLTRTTRSVSPTEAGDRLLRTVAPQIDAIRREIASLASLRDRPSGTIRLTADEHAGATILAPAVHRLLAGYPDITVEIAIDIGLVDIVAARYDAGIRLGEVIDQDMVSVPISGDQRMIVVGAPSCIGSAIPAHPKELIGRRCINLRLPTRGGLYVWEFEKDGRELKVRVDGPLILNSVAMMLEAALAGVGFAYLPEDMVRPHVQAGRLMAVLEDWSPAYPGYCLYYPHRRQPSAAFALLISSLRKG